MSVICYSITDRGDFRLKPVISADMKEQNRRVVYSFIRSAEGQRFSRSEISRATGISGPTVLKIVSFFEERGLIVPIGARDGGEPGRRASLYQFRPDAAYAVGASYDGQTLELSLVDLNGGTAKNEKLPLCTDVSSLVGDVLPRLVPEFVRGQGRILGLGISLPSVVDPGTQRVSCPAFPAMKSRVAKADLSQECARLSAAAGLPVLLENDVNAAALAEFRARDLSEGDDLIYIMFGGGLGAGLILDGKLRRGRNFSCGEVGYMVWDPAFRTDSGQSGYLEWELYRYSQDRFGTDLLAEPGAPLSYELTEHLATQLALAAANLANSLDVQLFVLGGSVYRRVGFTLLKLVNQKLRALSLHGAVMTEGLCGDACAKGAALQIMERGIGRLLAD